MLTYIDTPLGAELAPPEPRERGGWSSSIDAAFFPGAEAARAKLSKPDVQVVTTGQQPGLFTGPLYTIHKALSARAIAAWAEQRWSRPVVPVFWVAGDDHDFTEATVAHWLAGDGSLVASAVPARPADAPLTPTYRELVSTAVLTELDRLESSLPPGPSRDQAIGWLQRHYRLGANLAAASGGALAELLSSLGIVCLDGSHPTVKGAAAPILLEAIRRSSELDALLVEQNKKLEAQGIMPDVRVGDGATLAMLEATQGRDRLLPTDGGVVTRRSGERFSWSELESLIRSDPGRVSANVLLRPVVEGAVLPTVAYVGGGQELKYLELAEVLYRPLGVPRQRPLPRWSGILVEPRVSRATEKLGLALAELVDEPADLEQRLVKARAPRDFEAAFTALRQALEQGFDRVAAVATEIDPTLERPAKSLKGGALNSVTELEKKLIQAEKRRQGELLGQLERARTAVRPLGKPQERVLGIAGFVGRYGFDLVAELAAHVESWYRRALDRSGAPV